MLGFLRSSPTVVTSSSASTLSEGRPLGDAELASDHLGGLSLRSKPQRSYNYARSHRLLEVCGLLFGAALTLTTAVLALRQLTQESAWLALLCVFGGACLADFGSGLVHWSADTYGGPNMPVFGGFVRTFREHHRDQVDITRHDFIETNGDASIFTTPVHLSLLLLVESLYGLSCIFGLFFCSYMNSQIHKWAHQEQVPRLVRALQQSRVLLSPAHHSRHHAAPHLTHYCITLGWMNHILDRVGFFRKLEWALQKLGLERAT